MPNRPTLLIFYQNLRFHDQPLLAHAIQQQEVVLPVFINDPRLTDQLGGASQWWLYQSLLTFQKEWKEKFNQELILRTGDSLAVLQQLVQETNAHQIYLGNRYTAWEAAIDKKIEATFKQQNIEVRFFNTHLLMEPESLYNQQGKSFQVFTPFWKACLGRLTSPAPTSPPTSLQTYNQPIYSEPLASWKWGHSQAAWSKTLAKCWQPSENQAFKTLDTFLENSLATYDVQRNFIAAPPFTSQLSPYLRWGQVSARHVFAAVSQAIQRMPTIQKAVESFLSELGWREFSYYLLVHHPNMETTPLDKTFQGFPWQENEVFLKRWQQGMTGYPLVDAGMRQLWLEGWIPNRLRMVVASFLIKDLLIDWQLGLAWFGDTLVDADPANNANNWQWVAGCGADAAPYFRVFNPVKQSEKFDPTGVYIRKYVVELHNVAAPYIHQPWSMSASLQKELGVEIGKDYPAPMVTHAIQRDQALLYWRQLKGR